MAIVIRIAVVVGIVAAVACRSNVADLERDRSLALTAAQDTARRQ
jgi:hypothetical protein